MIRFHSILIALLVVICLAQQFVPTLSSVFDLRLLLVQSFILCATLTSGTSMMLSMAFIGGFMWDCQNTLNLAASTPDFFPEKVESLRFGYSALLFALMGAAMLGVRPLFREGSYKIPVFVATVTLYLYLWVEYLLINVVRGDFTVTSPVFIKITLTALLSATLAYPTLKLLSYLALACNHTIKNDKNRRFFSKDSI